VVVADPRALRADERVDLVRWRLGDEPFGILTERAEVVDGEGFPRVAAGLRSAQGEPLWDALALRIAESVLP